MPDDSDISELLERAKSGDQAAIREFLDRFEQEVRMMVRGRLPKLLRSRFDSMDFVQAVWQSFFSHLKDRSTDFENVQHLKGFLEAVARNKVYQQHRQLTRSKKHQIAREEPLYVRRGGREVQRDVESPDPTPSKTAQARERLAQLTAGCTPLEIRVITLRYEGLTHVEIGERTGLNERTVRRIISEAKTRMEERG